MERTRRLVLSGVLALALCSLVPSTTAQASRLQSTDGQSGCARNVDRLENIGFENPAIPASSVRILNQSEVPAWWTTATDLKIELWSSGFSAVPAAEGTQFAELNANMASALYQDIKTTPGAVLTWGLSHRGRIGTDTMRVLIGVPGGDLVDVAHVSDGTAAWGRHTGTYTVPAGQTCTRFAFEAVSAAGGPTVGNFLDAISFGTPAELHGSTEVSPAGMVAAGTTLTYSTSVTNQGGSASINAVVSNTLPLHTTFVPGSITLTHGSTTVPIADSAFDPATHTLTAQLIGSSGLSGVVAPDETITLSFQVTIDPAAAGTVLRNDTTLTNTDGRGVQTSTELDPTFVTAMPDADVAIDATATVHAHPGDTVSYALVVRNNGPMPALIGDGGEPAAQVVATLPSGIAPDAGSLPSECNASGQVITCDFSSTFPVHTSNPATEWAIAFTGTVAGDSPLGLRTLTATVTSLTTDATLGNNSISAGTTVALPTPAALQVVKSITTPSVHAGEPASLTIVVTNTGELATGAVTLTDTIPTGFTPTSVETTSGTCMTSSAITCNLGIILGGQSVTVSITGTTDAGLPDGTILTDSATATDGTVSAGDTGTITIDAASQLLVTKQMTTNPPVAGAPLGYTVTIQNLGPSNAQHVVIDDDLPSGTVLAATPAGCTLSGQHLTCALGALAVNQTATITYALSSPPGGGTLTNTATGTSDSTPINAGAATSATTTDLQQVTDLIVTETSSAYTVTSGQIVTLTFTVTNSGPSTATNVVVHNTPPTGFSYLNDGAATASPVGTNPLTPGAATFWDIGTLAPGATVTATIHAQVIGRPGGYANTITASGSATDNNALNDSATATLTIDPPTTTTSDPGSTPAESTTASTSTPPTTTTPPGSSGSSKAGGNSSSGNDAGTTGAGGTSGLARTGAPSSVLALIGAALVLAGAALVGGFRRHRRLDH